MAQGSPFRFPEELRAMNCIAPGQRSDSDSWRPSHPIQNRFQTSCNRPAYSIEATVNRCHCHSDQMHWLPADKLRYQGEPELIGDVIVPDINAVEIANMRQCVCGKRAVHIQTWSGRNRRAGCIQAAKSATRSFVMAHGFQRTVFGEDDEIHECLHIRKPIGQHRYAHLYQFIRFVQTISNWIGGAPFTSVTRSA